MRSWIVLSIVVALLAPARGDSPDASVVENSESSWPMFRGDAQGRGIAKTKLPQKLELLWQFEVKGGAFESTAAIVDGVVYVGDMDGEVRAIDLASGKQKWEYPTDSAFVAPTAVFNGRVYIGDMDGRFHCIHAETGKGEWVFETGAEIDGCANLLGENVLIGSQDAVLYCLNATTGDKVWEFGIQDQIRCTPTLIEGHVFVAGCDSRLHVIDAIAGKEVGFVEIGAPTNVTPAAEGDRIYFGTSSGSFFCVDWKKAEIVWQHAPEDRQFEVRSSPALADDLVVYGGRDKRLKAFHLDGKPLWTYTARSRIDGSPVIVEDRVYVGAGDGRLVAVDRTTGDEVWQFEARGGLNSSPAVADGCLVIGSDEGFLYCLGAKRLLPAR